MSSRLRPVALLLPLSIAGLLFVGLAGAPAARAAGEPPGVEKISGFDVALLAEAFARQATFRTQHGEKEGNAKFAEWLASRGLTAADFHASYAAWWERFRADPTGQLEARFHRINSEWSQQLNFGDAKDRRQEAREGVTLDQYAKVAVALYRQPGADVETVVKKNGLKGKAHWEKVNAAWAKAMKDDTSYALVQQYAALFQKHAGPQFEAEQRAVLANSLANPPKNAERPLDPPKPPPFEEHVANLDAKVPAERWRAARFVAVQCDLWLGPARKDPKDSRAKHCSREALEARLLPVMLDAIDHFDDQTLHDATGLLDYFGELDLKTSSAKMAIQRARNRTATRLETLEAAWAPIKDKAVPERLTLRQRLDDTRQAVKEFEETLEKW